MESSGMEDLLARAILELEQKMKHEFRQNSAYFLAKMEKHQEQMDKRLTHIEAKIDALNRDRDVRNVQQQHHNNARGGRYTGGTSGSGYPSGGGNRPARGANAYPLQERTFTANRPLGGGPTTTPYGGGVPPSPVGGQQQHPYKVFGFGGGGTGATATSGGTPPVNRQYRQQPKYDKLALNSGGGGHGHGGRYKQTLGTSKAQTTTSPTTQDQWTAKAAGVVYTDEEDSDDEDAASSEKSEYSVAKPEDGDGQQQQQDEEVENVEEKGANGGGKVAELVAEVVKTEDKMAIFETLVNGEKVFVSKFESYIEGEEVQQQPQQEHQDSSQNNIVVGSSSSSAEMIATGTKTASVSAAVAAMMNINNKENNQQPMSTVTPGATISPVIGGFGRSRRH